MLHAPVLRVTSTTDGIDIDLQDETTYSVTVDPLNLLPSGSTDETWGDMIGFGCNPKSLLNRTPKSIF